ncbi:outer membrane lipoprotein chaperone LolA [Thermomonas sp. HDW16]|uniref:outer membrane lipoprotein chaperone LolA n=1 Tax=Thermomonas sp. HDW16 TaxID=2714945 RepID=UPI00140A5AC4|nr:outer membrane lipoprotein chaperone LolA [Thermomonas sp. HDW16]QIL20633.1 outer membrane lipoprotein chaperone LolA [Thermomonas sp. HDW16]
MKFTASILTTALLLASGATNAGARDQLNTFTKNLKGLDGQFTQQVFDARGKQKESSTGRVAVSAPRLFRWEYVKPYPQLIVADGKNVWVYDPDLQQASKRPQGAEEANSPLAILLNPAKLDQDFSVKEVGVTAGIEWLQLTPKQAEAPFKTAKLGFSKAGLSQMEYVDALGQRTKISFSGWKRNPSFAKGTFVYVPAKGVDVIGG